MRGSALLVSSAHGVAPGDGGLAALVVPLLVSAVFCGLYLTGTVRYRRLRLRSWSTARSASFLAGTALLTVAISPAGASVAGTDASGHMAQHVAIGMLAPIGLVLGAPIGMLLSTVPVRARHLLARVLASRPTHLLTHPLVAGLLSVGSMYLLYLTPLYAHTTQHSLLHHFVHLHFLLAGCLFTWAIAGPEPTRRRPGIAVRVVALVLVAAAHSYLGKLLYARAGELPPGSGHGVAELQAAAQWMYYGGDLALVLLATALCAAWYRSAGHRSRRRAVGEVTPSTAARVTATGYVGVSPRRRRSAGSCSHSSAGPATAAAQRRPPPSVSHLPVQVTGASTERGGDDG